MTTAKGPIQWARVLGRMSSGRSDESPFVRMTRARKIDVKLGAPMTYELDGGAKDTVTELKAKVVPGGITVRVPETTGPDGRA